MLRSGITEVSPLRTINVWTKFHENPSTSFWRHFTKKHKCEPHGGATGKVRGSPESVFWGPWIIVPNFMAIHWIVFQIFQSGPTWWTDRPTDRLTLPSTEPKPGRLCRSDAESQPEPKLFLSSWCHSLNSRLPPKAGSRGKKSVSVQGFPLQSCTLNLLWAFCFRQEEEKKRQRREKKTNTGKTKRNLLNGTGAWDLQQEHGEVRPRYERKVQEEEEEEVQRQRLVQQACLVNFMWGKTSY